MVWSVWLKVHKRKTKTCNNLQKLKPNNLPSRFVRYWVVTWDPHNMCYTNDDWDKWRGLISLSVTSTHSSVRCLLHESDSRLQEINRRYPCISNLNVEAVSVNELFRPRPTRRHYPHPTEERQQSRHLERQNFRSDEGTSGRRRWSRLGTRLRQKGGYTESLAFLGRFP